MIGSSPRYPLYVGHGEGRFPPARTGADVSMVFSFFAVKCFLHSLTSTCRLNGPLRSVPSSVTIAPAGSEATLKSREERNGERERSHFFGAIFLFLHVF